MLSFSGRKSAEKCQGFEVMGRPWRLQIIYLVRMIHKNLLLSTCLFNYAGTIVVSVYRRDGLYFPYFGLFSPTKRKRNHRFLSTEQSTSFLLRTGLPWRWSTWFYTSTYRYFIPVCVHVPTKQLKKNNLQSTILFIRKLPFFCDVSSSSSSKDATIFLLVLIITYHLHSQKCSYLQRSKEIGSFTKMLTSDLPSRTRLSSDRYVNISG